MQEQPGQLVADGAGWSLWCDRLHALDRTGVVDTVQTLGEKADALWTSSLSVDLSDPADACALLVCVLVLAFLWPGKTSTVRDVPLAIAGPETAVAAVNGMIDDHAPGTFDVILVADRSEAVALIHSREVLGAIVLAAPPQAREVLTASAGGTAVAQISPGSPGRFRLNTPSRSRRPGEMAPPCR